MVEWDVPFYDSGGDWFDLTVVRQGLQVLRFHTTQILQELER
jgi:hypothetical protein